MYIWVSDGDGQAECIFTVKTRFSGELATFIRYVCEQLPFAPNFFNSFTYVFLNSDEVLVHKSEFNMSW